MSRRAAGRLGMVLLAAALAAWWMTRGSRVTAAAPPALGASVRRVVPAGTRIRVEVLNTTSVRGVARRVSLYLRDAGFDVVKYAGEGPPRDSTLVLDRTGHPEWAERLATALGVSLAEPFSPLKERLRD